MQILLSAPALSGYSLDSVRNYINYRFQKLEKLLPKFAGEHMIRLSIQREKRSFTVSVELMLPRPVFIQAEDINIFAAVDEALKVASRSVKRTRGKRKQR